jgi:peptidoglycan/xylan/chitin deacetylase (PgdA/CDA1 family)
MKYGVVLAVLLLLPAMAHGEQVDTSIIDHESIQRAPESCKCVAFRLDDVQDYFAREAQMDVIKLFNEENATLTLAVIGGFLYDDKELIDFIQNSIYNVEIANHGWAHSDHARMTINEQRDSIIKTNERIRELFGVEAKTFIPPENPFNNDTLTVMREVGLTHLSGSIFVKADEPPYPLRDGESILHFPQTAFVNNVDPATGIWTVYPNDQVLEIIRSSIAKYGFSVVAMHPVAYYKKEVSGYIYQEQDMEPLRDLLIEVKKEFKLVKISEIDKEGWIPKDVPRNMKLYYHTVSWNGNDVAIASSEDIDVEVEGGSLILKNEDIWVKPFMILIPENFMQKEPIVIAHDMVLPTMSWFDSINKMWVVYVDPPRYMKALHVVPEFPLGLLVSVASAFALYLVVSRRLDLTVL